MNTAIHFAGVPTKPDVDRLRKKYGVPEEGQLIPYDDIANTIGCDVKSDRFRTVVGAWRKALELEHTALMSPVRGKGLVRLNPDERVEFGVAREKSHFRGVGRAVRIVAVTDRTRLNADNARVADHMQRRYAAVKLALATSAKGIELPNLEKK